MDCEVRWTGDGMSFVAESGSGPSQPRWIQGLLTGEHLPQIRPRLYSRSGRGAEIAQPAGFRAHPPFK